MATQEIIKPGTINVIPATELPGLQNALVEMEAGCAVLASLHEKIRSIEVHDTTSYAQLGQYVAEATAVKKIPDFKLGSFLTMARRVVDWLRTEQNKHINAAEEIIALGKSKMADYKRHETAAAEAEQRRINEERRKAAELQAAEERKAREKEISKQLKDGEIGKREAGQLRKQADTEAEAAKQNVAEVTVKPSVPVISGLRMQTNWKFEIVDAARIPHKFTKPDEVAIGQHVRLLKDKERAEREIPGIRCWSE